jgi:two-component system chemotaxis response regulator CheV
MNNFIKSVDERTQLAGANRLEVLLFSLGFDHKTQRDEVFGINVFKVREVIQVPPVTHAPDMPPAVKGMVSLRGTMVPILKVAEFCNMDVREEPEILIVTEYNKQTQGLLVHSVEHILRMEWSDMKVPPPMLAHSMGGLITAVTELEDKRIVMLLDVERILSETAKFGADIDEFSHLEEYQDEATVIYADDSSVARKQIERTLESMGIKHVGARNGREAWDLLQDYVERAELSNVPLHTLVNAILTDVEMPEMDGYVLTKKIKSDNRFHGIPVLMHSSLSAEANVAIGKSVGADIYVPKFSPKDLADALRPLIKSNKTQS